jgi:hypothetical protein
VERLEVEELECWWRGFAGPGLAVHGRWSGELGFALTGRKNCWSDRGDGTTVLSGPNVAALKLLLELLFREFTSRELEDWCEYVCVRRAGWVAAGGEGFSKSEQYAESRPREGGVLSDCSRSRWCALTVAETERTR